MKKLIITEEERNRILNLHEQAKNSVSLDPNKTPGGYGGTTGVVKGKEKEETSLSELTDEQLGAVLRDKLVKDLGVYAEKAFTYLSTDQSENVLNTIFDLEHLPKDFIRNPNDYKFISKKGYLSKYTIPPIKENDPRYNTEINKIKLLNNFYIKINDENIKNFVGFGKENPTIVFSSNSNNPGYLLNGMIKFDTEGKPITGTINKNGLSLYFPEKGIAGEVTTKGGTSESKTYKIQTPPIRASFDVDEFAITQGIRDLLVSELNKVIQNNELIKQATSKNIEYSITNIEIISSASNTYKGIVAPTHDIDGNPTGLQYNETKSKDGKTPYTGNFQKNYNLANNRGLSLQNELSTNETLKNLLKLSPGVKFQISPRITDTGGQVDNPNTDKPGQYAKFIFTVSFKEEFEKPGESSGSAVFGNIVIQLIKQKSDYNPPFAFFTDLFRKKILKPGGGFRKSRRIANFSGLKLG
jgi:hypothetical protein